MKKFFPILLTAVLLTGCGGGVTQRNDYTFPMSSKDSSVAESTEIPEGAIVDESGTFVFEGKTQQIGTDEDGYIKVPLGYAPYQDEGIEGMTQYSDSTGANIFTLDYYEGMSYQMAAESMRNYLSQDENMENLQGATSSLNGYTGLQLYGHYKDGYFIVAYFIQDPENTSNSYYLAIEFDPDHQNLVALSSTFRTKEDYHKENP